MKARNIYLLAMLLVSFSLTQIPASGQVGVVSIECGTIIDAELTTTSTTNRHSGPDSTDYYSISLGPGDRITVTVTPISPTQNIYFRLYDPANQTIYDTNWGAGSGQAEIMEDFLVGATGTYEIGIGANRIGAYTLSVGCVYRDGTLIVPGDIDSTTNSEANANGSGGLGELVGGEGDTAPVDFSGFGIPSLAPVDFSQGVKIPLTSGVASPGSITEGFTGIFGYEFQGNEGQQFSLQFTRTAGNLNLGLAVITASNEVAFQASLINSNVLITQFNLPATDTYTIGVYRIDLNPPDSPQATSFEITGTLN